MKRHDQAIERLNAILERDPNNATSLNNLGNVYTMLGQAEEAKVAYAHAREADQADPGIQLNEGLAHKTSGDDEKGNQVVAAAIQQAGGSAGSLRPHRYQP